MAVTEAAPPATVVTPTAREPIVVKLSEPMLTHEGYKDELTFGPVTVQTLMRHGDPVTSTIIGAGVSTEIRKSYNYPAVFHIAAQSTGVREEMFLKLTLGDVHKIVGAVLELFYPSQPTTISA